MIKVAIVDDQKIFSEGLKMVLSQEASIQVIGTYSNGEAIIHGLKKVQPDVILMDVEMPFLNGVEAVKRIKEIYKEINIIMLTTFHNEEYIYQAIKYGASGYLLKDTEISTIIDAIKSVDQGVVINPTVAKIILNQFNSLANERKKIISREVGNLLTKRELEIAIQVSEGLSNKEISEKLFLGEGTIKNHMTHILQKLELRDRTQIAIYMLKNR